MVGTVGTEPGSRVTKLVVEATRRIVLNKGWEFCMRRTGIRSTRCGVNTSRCIRNHAGVVGTNMRACWAVRGGSASLWYTDRVRPTRWSRCSEVLTDRINRRTSRGNRGRIRRITTRYTGRSSLIRAIGTEPALGVAKLVTETTRCVVLNKGWVNSMSRTAINRSQTSRRIRNHTGVVGTDVRPSWTVGRGIASLRYTNRVGTATTSWSCCSKVLTDGIDRGAGGSNRRCIRGITTRHTS